MNKTDKLLYGGFGVVALAVIVAMLVSIFSPPKKPAMEVAAPPKAEQLAMETDLPAEEPPQPENNYVAYWVDDNGNKVWITQEEYDSGLAYAEEQKRKEAEAKAEKEWWESRQDWIDRFPFEPTYHPELAYDPEAYDPSKVREWPEEKKDKAYWEMQEMVDNTASCGSSTKAVCPTPKSSSRCTPSSPKKLAKKRRTPS